MNSALPGPLSPVISCSASGWIVSSRTMPSSGAPEASRTVNWMTRSPPGPRPPFSKAMMSATRKSTSGWGVGFGGAGVWVGLGLAVCAGGAGVLVASPPCGGDLRGMGVSVEAGATVGGGGAVWVRVAGGSSVTSSFSEPSATIAGGRRCRTRLGVSERVAPEALRLDRLVHPHEQITDEIPRQAGVAHPPADVGVDAGAWRL